MNRYTYTSTFKRWDGKNVYNTLLLYPIGHSESDIYIITDETVFLDQLAYTYYNDPSLWWIIAQANNIGKGRLSVEPGTQIRIPSPSNVLNGLKAINS